MTSAPSLSLVVVSRSRPQSLKRLLCCLRHQTLTGFQTLVVTNSPAHIVGAARHVPFFEANISAARNAGIARASGDVVAFCDDDCVPEPRWLERLSAPFADPLVGAAGGYVRNRNGVAFQSKAVAVNRRGNDTGLKIEAGPNWSCPEPPDGHVLKTTGTNCAFRRRALLDVGGFSPALRYYLEDADLNIRLTEAGWQTAIVPGAQVHHGLHEGPYRDTSGVPKDLFEIGASLAWFLARHCEPDQISDAISEFREGRLRRLQHLRERGHLSEEKIRILIKRLDEGIVAGAQRACTPGFANTRACPPEKLPAPLTAQKEKIVVLARPFRRRTARRLAQILADSGKLVTLIDFRPGIRFLKVSYTAQGYWLHRGGSFGRACRSEPIFRWATIRTRCREEIQRIAGQRKFDTVIEVSAWTLPGALGKIVRTGEKAPKTLSAAIVNAALSPALRE